MGRATVVRAAVAITFVMGAASLWGCVVRPTHPVAAPQTQAYVVQQPQQVLVAQPVVVSRPAAYVVRQAPIVVHRPPVVVTQPPVLYPRRYTALVSPSRHCAPGTQRSCGEQTYCGGYDGGGMQYCMPDGMSWGPCYETRY